MFRLLWKEWMESRWMLLGLLAAPPFTIVALKDRYSRLEEWKSGRMSDGMHANAHSSSLPSFQELARLLWKEFHELKWWSVTLVILPTLFVAGGHSLTFRGYQSPWEWPHSLIWMAGGVVFGALAYSREHSWDKVRFLYSRPLRWWHLWVVKFTIGAAACGASVVVPAVVYRLLCPPHYRPFADFATLAHGGARAFAMVFLPYVFGFGCSLLMPNVSLTLCAIFGTLATVFMIVEGVLEKLGRQTVEALGLPMPFFIIGPTMILASLVIARRLTHPLPARMQSFGNCMAAALVMLIVVSLPFEKGPDQLGAQLSPDRKFIAAFQWRDDKGRKGHALFVHSTSSDGRSLLATAPQMSPLGWSPDSRRYLFLTREHGGVLLKAVDVADGKTETLAYLPRANRGDGFHYWLRPPRIVWSPSGHRLVFSVPTEPGITPNQRYFLCDFPTRRLIELPEVAGPARGGVWWLSDHELAFCNDNGQMWVFRVRSEGSGLVVSHQTIEPSFGFAQDRPSHWR